MAKKVDNKRAFPGCPGLRPDHFNLKQKEAAERQEAYDKLSNKERLAKLDDTFGVGLGAKRQRARIAFLMEKHTAKPVVEEVSEEAQEDDQQPKKLKAKDRRRQERNKES